jgi:hypothetical protein
MPLPPTHTHKHRLHQVIPSLLHRILHLFHLLHHIISSSYATYTTLVQFLVPPHKWASEILARQSLGFGNQSGGWVSSRGLHSWDFLMFMPIMKSVASVVALRHKNLNTPRICNPPPRRLVNNFFSLMKWNTKSPLHFLEKNVFCKVKQYHYDGCEVGWKQGISSSVKA